MGRQKLFELRRVKTPHLFYFPLMYFSSESDFKRTMMFESESIFVKSQKEKINVSDKKL